VMVTTYTRWWQRKWHGERPTADLPDIELLDPYGAVDDREHVRRLLAELPRRQRAVIVLRYYEDLPERDIAEALGMSPGTVKSTAAAAMAKLRAMLAEHGEDAPPPEPAAVRRGTAGRASRAGARATGTPRGAQHS
jgi:DNA-directed RNA polymerase specialized sigma24 family protein